MSYAWFLIVYILIGIVFLWLGTVLVRSPERMVNYLVKTAESGSSPRLLVRWLKYLFSFSVVSLIVSLIPFNLAGLLYSLSCLMLTFVFGRLLLMWDEVRNIIPEKKAGLASMSRKTGYILLTISALSLALWYLHLHSV